ncbi:peptide chain release factor N(5)-glutamine methyltransferase [Criibacterium bergeronii]|uniref:Release factor glutamine methyltransferase n=1 Tax=Criibacterium bergeronii TaxID=1871336 RepID=A0A371IJM6_9FIRM|nr:peptide chain release factor N(5)-glutamine methyltransferase [Criibacterium bergeronii]RDY20685.1 peptide chain release factor N(5)-glutamine methyltransferase [Criibacterium bergeronii]
MKIKDIYKYSLEKLNNDEEKFLLTEMIIAYVLEKDRIYIKLNMDDEINNRQAEKIKGYVERLTNNEPIHYIIGKRDFMGMDFYVTQNVLIPRSDTEVLVTEAINALNQEKKYAKDTTTGLEIGAGSGIISISLLKKIENLNMTAVDINCDAIRLTTKNAVELGVYPRLKVLKSDIYSKVNEKYDFIISNPPYIRTDEIQRLDPKIKNYEPLNALDGGESGIEFYDKIIRDAKAFLNKDGYLFLEIGYDQKDDVSNLFSKHNINVKLKVVKDLAGYDRVIIAKFI